MDPFPQFWLPVLAAAVSVFVASALIHMVLRWHRRDYLALAGEESIREAIRAGAPQPGLYPLPYCGDMKDMNDPAVQARYREGPVALITVMPTTLSAVLAAHASATAHASLACVAGCVGGLATFMAYGAGSLSNGIWMGQRWGHVARDLLDALVYGAATGATFCWLWPGG